MRALSLLTLLCGYCVLLVLLLPRVAGLPALGLLLYVGAILLFRTLRQLE